MKRKTFEDAARAYQKRHITFAFSEVYFNTWMEQFRNNPNFTAKDAEFLWMHTNNSHRALLFEMAPDKFPPKHMRSGQTSKWGIPTTGAQALKMKDISHTELFLKFKGADVVCENCEKKIEGFPVTAYIHGYPIYKGQREAILVCCSLRCSKALEKRMRSKPKGKPTLIQCR